MAFVSTIVVVEDVMRSRKLYEELFDLKITGDFGIYNIGYEGGLSFYKKTLFQDLTGNIPIVNRPNNFVLYFEVENIDEIEREIKDKSLEFIHEIKEQPWGQRVFRFYDYDQNILEIAEKMEIVFKRMKNDKWTLKEMARKTGYTKEKVEELLKMNENKSKKQ